MWPNKKILALTIMAIFVLGFTFSMMPTTTKVSFVGSASASPLGDNITAVLNEWLPLIILLSFVALGLGILGIRIFRGRR